MEGNKRWTGRIEAWNQSVLANSRMASPEGNWSLPNQERWWGQTCRSEFADSFEL